MKSRDVTSLSKSDVTSYEPHSHI